MTEDELVVDALESWLVSNVLLFDEK